MSFVFVVELRDRLFPEGGGGEWDAELFEGFSAKRDIVIDENNRGFRG